MDRVITRKTPLTAVRVMLFADGYERFVRFAESIKSAAADGNVSWTKDGLRVVGGIDIDAKPYERTRNALIVKAVQGGKANDAAKRALRDAGIAAATVREAMVLRKPK